jgi:hypothetical protein
MSPFTQYRPFPNPRKAEYLHAPFGPGLYDLRRVSTKKPVLFGIGGNCAKRMTSLLPSDKGGSGSRNNSRKRNYVARHRNDIEYRTCALRTKEEAAELERTIKRELGHLYTFNT